MPAGTPIALTTVRVRRGQTRPVDEVFRAAIERDRAELGMTPADHLVDFTVAGPYGIIVDGDEIDEYVVWEL